MFSPQRIISATMVALAVAALAASGAAAQSLAGAPVPSGQSGSAQPVIIYSRQDKQVVRPATPAPAPRFTAPTGGFSLTDGFITMGGVLLLLALATGVAVSRSRRRTALSH